MVENVLNELIQAVTIWIACWFCLFVFIMMLIASVYCWLQFVQPFTSDVMVFIQSINLNKMYWVQMLGKARLLLNWKLRKPVSM